MRRRVKKGMRCQRWQRIPGPGGRLRCEHFIYVPRSRGPRPGHNLGKRCIRFKRVFGPWHDKKVWRCAKYGRGVSAVSPLRMRLLKVKRRVEARRPPPARAAIPGHIPLSLPSMERVVAGRTPTSTRKTGRGFV